MRNNERDNERTHDALLGHAEYLSTVENIFIETEDMVQTKLLLSERVISLWLPSIACDTKSMNSDKPVEGKFLPVIRTILYPCHCHSASLSVANRRKNIKKI